MAENVANCSQIMINFLNQLLSSHWYKITILKLMTASSKISPAFTKKHLKKTKITL